jgi:hypothetical protein
MLQYAIKLILSAGIIVIVSEIAKRSSFFGALIASLPLTSLLAMIWLYLETRDVEKVAALSSGIFWLVIPSLALFLFLPVLLRTGFGFAVSLAISCGSTAVLYLGLVKVLSRFGVVI